MRIKREKTQVKQALRALKNITLGKLLGSYREVTGSYGEVISSLNVSILELRFCVFLSSISSLDVLQLKIRTCIDTFNINNLKVTFVSHTVVRRNISYI